MIDADVLITNSYVRFIAPYYQCDILSVDILSYCPYFINMDRNKLIELGTRIKDFRKEVRLSQEELAFRCGFDRTYISMLERGKRNPSYLNLLKLSKGLNIEISQLVKGLV